MVKFAMQNEDKGKPNFFDILISYQSYLRFFYSLFALPLSILIFTIVLLSLVLGVVLFPFGIGIYVLNFFFATLHYITKKEEQLIEYFIGINLPKVSLKVLDKNQAFLKLTGYVKDNRNWKRLFYFIIKPIYIIPFIIPAFLFLLLSVTLIYMPLRSVFGSIDFFGFYSTKSFIEVIFFYFVSAVLLVGIFHLNDITTKASCGISKKFLSR